MRNDLGLLTKGIARQTRLNFVKMALGRLATGRGLYVSSIYPRILNAKDVFELMDIWKEYSGDSTEEALEIFVDIISDFRS